MAPPRIAVVCASNQNRSMEAHYVLRCDRPSGLGQALRPAPLLTPGLAHPPATHRRRLPQPERLPGQVLRDGLAGEAARPVGRPAKHLPVRHALRRYLRRPQGAGRPAVQPVHCRCHEARRVSLLTLADLPERTGALARYTRNGVLKMLERNRTVKRAPERFRDAKDKFDVIICCEERCFDQVLEGTAP